MNEKRKKEERRKKNTMKKKERRRILNRLSSLFQIHPATSSTSFPPLFFSPLRDFQRSQPPFRPVTGLKINYARRPIPYPCANNTCVAGPALEGLRGHCQGLGGWRGAGSSRRRQARMGTQLFHCALKNFLYSTRVIESPKRDSVS
jgi:hypothetical protein